MASLPTRLRFLLIRLQEPQISNFMFSTAVQALHIVDEVCLLLVKSLCEVWISLASDHYDYVFWNMKPCSLVSLFRKWQRWFIRNVLPWRTDTHEGVGSKILQTVGNNLPSSRHYVPEDITSWSSPSLIITFHSTEWHFPNYAKFTLRKIRRKLNLHKSELSVNYTVELHLTGRWLSGSSIIRTSLLLRVNLPRFLQN